MRRYLTFENVISLILIALSTIIAIELLGTF